MLKLERRRNSERNIFIAHGEIKALIWVSQCPKSYNTDTVLEIHNQQPSLE